MTVRRPVIGLATCAQVPDLDEDGPVLVHALHPAGADAHSVIWDDPAVAWTDLDLVVVRSTWDYPARRKEFLAWAAARHRIANSAPVLTWNTDKRYLQDLRRAGVPVVPGHVLEPGDPYRPPASHGDVVVKPVVGAGAADTGRYPDGSPGAAELTAALHRQGRAVLVQPYLTEVDTDGETALVYLAGALSHAVRKAPLLVHEGTRPPVVGDAAHALLTPAVATSEQQAVAAAALAAVPGGPERLPYARVDLVPTHDGPVVLELELTEPSLFLRYAPQAAIDDLAQHLMQLATR